MRVFETPVGILFGVLLLGVSSALAQGGSESAYDLVNQDRFAAAFQKGDTNTPLLAMDWFSQSHSDEYCRVDRSGRVSSARNVINWAIQGSHHAQLSQTNIELLVATMNALPPPPKAAPPPERWLVVQGIQTNKWFKNTYDRANIPEAVEKLYEITGASLVWFIPKVNGRQIARAGFGRFACVANEAPIAVSVGEERTVQVWNLEAPNKVPPVLNILPYEVRSWEASAIAPDGSIVAAARSSGLCGVDLRTGKLLWQAGPLDSDDYNGKLLAVGNKGRSLFTAGAHNIERWDIETGQRLALLATNSMIVQFLSTSHDGSILLAGAGRFNSSPSLFTLWDTSKNEPVLEFAELNLSGISISPDGRQIAFSVFGRKTLYIYDWRAGHIREVPLRCPYAASSAYALYWSPDGKLLAANVNTYQNAIVIYDTTAWKPLAQWDCGALGPPLSYVFTKSGLLVQLRGAELDGLDTTGLKALGD